MFESCFLDPDKSFLTHRKNSLNIKFLGRIFLGSPGPRRRDIPDKNFMQVAFFCCFRQGVAGMSRDLGRDVPDLEKLYARKLWAVFSYPILTHRKCHFLDAKIKGVIFSILIAEVRSTVPLQPPPTPNKRMLPIPPTLPPLSPPPPRAR